MPKHSTTPKAPSVVFRLFREEAHADQFTNGIVHFSTLSRCRAYEGANGDSDEATRRRQYRNTEVELRKLVDKRASEAGLQMPWDELSGTPIKAVQFLERIEEAYVLCCTTRIDYQALFPKFGNYCVRIERVPDFCEIAGLLLGLYAGTSGTMSIGNATYNRRLLLADEPARGHIGFLKSRQYSDEKEFRLLVPVPDGMKIEPKSVMSPLLSEFVQRLT